MKRNLLCGIALIGAMALSSCAVNKTASTTKNSDDVYFSQATAGEEPEYVAPKPVYNQQSNDVGYNDDDDYYYYDDYATRINRFSYYSPFSYYDPYYSYSPYYNNFSVGLGYSPWYSSFGYSPFGFYGGLGFGYGAFSPYAGYYGYGYPYGYGYGYGYSPYSYFGTGYGGYPYWGVYSAYGNYSGSARPFRGNGSPRGAMGTRPGMGYAGATGGGYYNGRPGRPGAGNGSYGRPTGTNSYGGNNYGGNYNGSRPTRPARNDAPANQPRPQVERTYTPPPSNSGSFGGGGGGGSSSGGGGGGGRPARP